jgi:hypothetical protein
LGNPIDSHATHAAGNCDACRNSSTQLYQDNFGGVQAPAAQVTEYPQQLGTTPLGSIGMEWHEVEVAKVGNSVTWTMDGVLLATVDMTNFVEQPDGTNIALGHADINAGSSTEPDRFDLQFSLFDNVEVVAIAVGQDGDHNGDGTVDAADYVDWRKDPANNGGDPDGYDAFFQNFGEPPPPGGGGSGAVPEPASVALAVLGLMLSCIVRRRRA